MPSLDGPRLKCERAKEHLDNLTAEIAAYYSRKPYAISRDVHPEDPTRQVFRLNVREEPPLRLGIILGDVVHNLRSALDHLAFQLALVHTPMMTPKEETRIEFPIYKDSTLFNTEGLRKIDKLSPAAQNEIKSLQPYHRGKDAELHFLWLVHSADIIDKHRQIVPRFTAYAVPILGTDGAIIGSFKDGDVVGVASANDNPDEDFQPPFFYAILFEIGGSRPIAPANFYTIYQFISDDVLPRFAGFFS